MRSAWTTDTTIHLHQAVEVEVEDADVVVAEDVVLGTC